VRASMICLHLCFCIYLSTFGHNIFHFLLLAVSDHMRLYKHERRMMSM
jgi:hypothetical protein